MHLSATFLLPLAASAVLAQPTTQTSTIEELSTPSVTLDYSTIIPGAGNASLGYYKYQNIRFAAVPIGDLRWAKPQWPPIEDAVNNGSLADANVDCASEEDCLYMDIWAPANSKVWTYGGGFTGGSKFFSRWCGPR